jgi:ubiquinol-cytochrome c reductase cytochrome b subunit
LGCFYCKSSKLIKIIQFFFWMFIFNFLLLGWLGSCIVEQPYILLSQIASIFYFFYFLILLPVLSFCEKIIVGKKK